MESALNGTHFGHIPDEINAAFMEDLHRISESFAAPLAFLKQEHQLCPFIPHKQLALHANPLFWQYGLRAFVSGCSFFSTSADAVWAWCPGHR